MIELGHITMVEPRTLWPHEAHDFTPWIADNLQTLGEAIGMDLEMVEREADVGGFSLDLLARDLGSGGNVIIENQLESTDHDHLGKLITYASGFSARTIVWVSTALREEHRQALDWLNQRTDTDTNFFGVVIRVIKIGDSKPALQFVVEACPNEWQKTRKQSNKSERSERSELYRQYFQQLIDELREDHHFTGARKAQPQNWYSFASGTRMFTYGHSFAAGGRARTEIYIDSGDGTATEAFFEGLYAQRDHYEQTIGYPLQWERLENRRACRVATYCDASITDDEASLAGTRNWAVKTLLAFKQAFGSETASHR